MPGTQKLSLRNLRTKMKDLWILIIPLIKDFLRKLASQGSLSDQEQVSTKQ
jgi:hypothetical protein